MVDKITEELVAENIALSDKLAKAQKELFKHKEAEFAYTFHVMELSKASGTLKIRGVFLAEGIWKGMKFTYEKMKAFAKKFIGIPIMKDHGWDPRYGTTKGGIITKVVPIDSLRCLAFEGDVTLDAFKQLVEDGTVDAISAKANWTLNEKNEVVDVESAVEGSLTGSPVCEFCNLFSVGLSNYTEQLNNSLDNIIDTSVDESNMETKLDYVEVSLSNWNTDYLSSLPDSAFAIVINGERKFPYRDKDGLIVVPELLKAINGTKDSDVNLKLQSMYKKIRGE